jgi:hypothetical protein
MVLTITTILLIVAAVMFMLSTFAVPSKVNWQPLGLFFATVAFLIWLAAR